MEEKNKKEQEKEEEEKPKKLGFKEVFKNMKETKFRRLSR